MVLARLPVVRRALQALLAIIPAGPMEEEAAAVEQIRVTGQEAGVWGPMVPLADLVAEAQMGAGEDTVQRAAPCQATCREDLGAAVVGPAACSMMGRLEAGSEQARVVCGARLFSLAVAAADSQRAVQSLFGREPRYR